MTDPGVSLRPPTDPARGWNVAAAARSLAPLGLLVLVQQLLWPAPSGVVLNGALVGARVALIALGIALVYRANRVVNFAQGELGALPASFAVMLVVAAGWNYWVSFTLGLVAAVLLGAIVESLIIRRFFSAPRLVLTVATIGVAQLLMGVGVLLPRAFGDRSFGTRLDQPFDVRWTVGGTVFNATDALTLLLVPVALLALATFLRRSTIGLAVVGAAERSDRAFTLGIPVRRLHTVVWVIATVLAYLAMFLRAGSVGLPIGEVLGPTVLVQALGAAVFGRFERLPTIVGAAVGLGIVEQAMSFQPGSRPAFNDAVLFVIVLAGLLLTVRRSGTSRRTHENDFSWRSIREVRPIPRTLRYLPEVFWGRAFAWALLLAAVLTLPMWLSTSRLGLATVIAISGIVAASLVVLSGWAGQVSLGQMAFVGLGAAVGGVFSTRWDQDLFVSLVGAGAIGAVAAVVVGYPALRRGGLALAVSTLAFGLVVSSYVLNRGIFGDVLPARRFERGRFLTIDVRGETAMFYLAVAVLLLALAAAANLRRTRTGRVLIGARENERALRAYGVDATRSVLAAFAFSGFLAAVAGGLLVQQQNGLTADPYLPQRSLDLFTMVVIGGLGSLSGALVGAVYVQGVDFFLPPGWRFLATGTGLLFVLLVFPTGLGGAMADVRDGVLRRVARRRGLVVPELISDPDRPPAEVDS